MGVKCLSDGLIELDGVQPDWAVQQGSLSLEEVDDIAKLQVGGEWVSKDAGARVKQGGLIALGNGSGKNRVMS